MELCEDIQLSLVMEAEDRCCEDWHWHKALLESHIMQVELILEVIDINRFALTIAFLQRIETELISLVEAIKLKA
jgi:hypothetical protein